VTSGVVQVTFTAGERATAERIVDALVADGWAACGQVDGPVRSTYRWRGRVETAEEWRATLKTSAAAAPAVVARVRADHDYDVPEVLVTAVEHGDDDYVAWVLDESSGAPGE
jgi:periplasmic divalent cation tolerance protein